MQHNQAISFRVTGKVQGVYFRANTRRQARRPGLVGWVANRSDGAVEGVAYGQQKALQEFQNWLNLGPKKARVDHVYTQDQALDTPIWHSFKIIR